jgi:two-component system OmpR family sensor kinase
LVINLTASEKRTFIRFLSLYLGSSLILMLLIATLYFQKEKSLYFDLLKSNMQNITSKISSEIIISHMHINSFDKDIYVDSGKYEGSFGSKRKEYLESKDYKIAFYDDKEKKLFGSLEDKIDFSKTISFNNKSLILIDSSTVGHLGIEYIVIKDQSFEKKLSDLKINIILFFLAIYLIIALVGFYLAKLFLKPIKDERIKLNNFIKDTTHELNTPISAILMSCENDKLSEKQIQRVRLSAKRVSDIYKDLVYVFLQSNDEKKLCEKVSLDKLILEQVDYIEPIASKKKINISVSLENLEFLINKDDGIRLLNNLISNAIKYNKVGGSIDISLKNRTLKISDSGIGIAEDKLKDIYKRYYRATSEQGGFGIGLNIVSHICAKYDIQIDVESKKDFGSTFSLKF